MGRVTYHGRGGRLRIYDGSGGTAMPNNGAGTPFFIEVPFSNMDFSGDAAKPRPPDPIVVTAGGYVHRPQSDDYEAAYYEPVEFSFSCLIDDTTNRVKLRDALCNIDLKTTWAVGNNNWSSTKGRGSIILPDNTFVATQPFFDSRKVSVDMELLWENVKATTNTGMRYEEAWFPPQELTINESPDKIELAIRGLGYGDVSAISAFSKGNES